MQRAGFGVWDDGIAEFRRSKERVIVGSSVVGCFAPLKPSTRLYKAGRLLKLCVLEAIADDVVDGDVGVYRYSQPDNATVYVARKFEHLKELGHAPGQLFSSFEDKMLYRLPFPCEWPDSRDLPVWTLRYEHRRYILTHHPENAAKNLEAKRSDTIGVDGFRSQCARFAEFCRIAVSPEHAIDSQDGYRYSWSDTTKEQISQALDQLEAVVRAGTVLVSPLPAITA